MPTRPRSPRRRVADAGPAPEPAPVADGGDDASVAGGDRGGGRFARRNLPLLLLQAREAVMARFRPILNAHGVTEQQWRIVRALLEHGPSEPRELVSRCCISSPSLAGVLARMERMGLVERERMAEDQRRVRVDATAQAQRLAGRVRPHAEAAYAALEADLGKGFMAELYARLDRTIDRLDRA